MELNIYHDLELISIHIPKCGGTTFNDILNRIYLDRYKHIIEVSQINNIDKNTRCIHGHYRFNPEWLKIYPNAKRCTWIRHPVDRLISHYYYWGNFIFGPNAKYNPNLTKMKIKKYTLFEFAEQSYMKNRMFDFIEDISLDDIDFIGDVANYRTDLMRLVKIMNWDPILINKLPHLNKSRYTKKIFGKNLKITEEDRIILANILNKDMERYEYIKNKCYPSKKKNWWKKLIQKKKYLP